MYEYRSKKSLNMMKGIVFYGVAKYSSLFNIKADNIYTAGLLTNIKAVESWKRSRVVYI